MCPPLLKWPLLDQDWDYFLCDVFVYKHVNICLNFQFKMKGKISYDCYHKLALTWKNFSFSFDFSIGDESWDMQIK